MLRPAMQMEQEVQLDLLDEDSQALLDKLAPGVQATISIQKPKPKAILALEEGRTSSMVRPLYKELHWIFVKDDMKASWISVLLQMELYSSIGVTTTLEGFITSKSKMTQWNGLDTESACSLQLFSLKSGSEMQCRHRSWEGQA